MPAIDEISKEIFLEYEKIRMSGRYNMFMQAYDVAKILKISINQYQKIIFNYSELCDKYLKG